MLTFFTDPYPDELLYSAIARYHFYIGNIDFKDTLKEIFGKRSIVPDFYLGSHINTLAERLGNKYSSEELIDKCTIFPFYEAFLPKERKREIVEEMKWQDGGSLYTRLGMVAGSICKHNGICYCAECVKVDQEKYGEAYIHREHQLQGVFMCPIHGTVLKLYKLNARNTSRLEFIRLDVNQLNDQELCEVPHELQELLRQIAAIAYKLLKLPKNNIDEQSVKRKYKELLGKKDLLSSNGRVKQKELHEAFCSFYSTSTLKFLESEIDEANEYNWLKVITRNSRRMVHPLRHILLINFLSRNIDEFFEASTAGYQPFGYGPWPCLNKASVHYGENVITSVVVTADYKSRLPVGTFSCTCGFVYSRKGPDREPADRFKIGRIKAFGEEWDNCLRECISTEEVSLRGIARRMGCDPKTVKKRLLLLKDKPNVVSDENKCGNDCLEIYKETILQVIKTNSKLSRTQIRELVKKEYIYVYRKDKEWLFMNLPPKTKAFVCANKVDWKARDVELLEAIKVKEKELLTRKKTTRITRSIIGKELGCKALIEKKSKYLPNSRQYLDEIEEEVLNFQVRRCKAIIQQAKKEDKVLKLWQIQKQGGLRKKHFELIKHIIEAYMKDSKNRE